MLTFRKSPIRREDLQRIAQFLERLVDQLDVAAIGLVAQQLERVGDDLADHVAVGHLCQRFKQCIRVLVHAGEIRARHLVGRFVRLGALFNDFIF